MRARKKPVVVDVFRHDGTDWPDWAAAALATGALRIEGLDIVAETLEGPMTCPFGWWIIRGVEGEVYPCKDSVFEATYDLEPDGPEPTVEDDDLPSDVIAERLEAAFLDAQADGPVSL